MRAVSIKRSVGASMAERLPSLDACLHLPGKMKLSSHRAGWRSLLLRGYDDPPSADEFLTPATDDHLIVLVTGGFCAINVRYGSGWRTAQQRKGVLAMTAPGEPATLRWKGESSHSTLQLHLPDATVRRVQEDLEASGNPRRLLMSGVGMFDPFVEQLMIASANAVRLGASDLYAESAAEMLAVYMMGRGDPLSVSLGREERRLRLVDDFMRDNLGSPITLERLAEEAGLSRFHILRLFNRYFRESPLKRLTRLRMEQAAVLLRSTTETITAIGELCGYENPSHFATAFRRHYALSPREYRNMK